MAVFNEPTKWQTSLVNSGDANVIPQSTPVGTGEASFDDGFPQITQIPIGAGGIAPDRKDFNGLFKILGDWIFFNQNGGVSTYSENFDYVAGRVVSYNDNIYKCIQANGVSSTVVAPGSDTTYWQRIDNFVRSVNGVNADTQGNVSDIVESGSNYIRYANGVQICWGTVQKYTLTWADHQSDHNLPKPFKDTNYTVQTTGQGVGEDFIHVEVNQTDKSYFHCSFIPFNTYSDGTIKVLWDHYSKPWNGLYLAIGYWK